MITISYHDSVNDLQAVPFTQRGPFARASWFGLLEAHAPGAIYAMASKTDAALCLPLVVQNGKLSPLTNWYAFTYSPLFTGLAPDAALARALAKDLARRAAQLTFGKLPAEDGTLTLLQQAFAQSGWLAFAAPCDTNHVLDVAGRDYAAFLAARPGPLRTTLKRKAKKVDVRLSTRFDAGDWSAYEAIYADSWKPEEGNPTLLRRFAETESDCGRFRFALALAEGEPVAAQFWTVDHGTAYIHKLAHREEAKPLSPGTTLSAALFEQVIDRDGVQSVDFGTGDDAYKRDWMESQRPRYQLRNYRPASPRNWPEIGKGMLRQLVAAKPLG